MYFSKMTKKTNMAEQFPMQCPSQRSNNSKSILDTLQKKYTHTQHVFQNMGYVQFFHIFSMLWRWSSMEFPSNAHGERSSWDRSFYVDFAKNCGLPMRKNRSAIFAKTPSEPRDFWVEAISHREPLKLEWDRENNEPPGCSNFSLRWEITRFWQENHPSAYLSPVLYPYIQLRIRRSCCWTPYFWVKNPRFHKSHDFSCQPRMSFPLGSHCPATLDVAHGPWLLQWVSPGVPTSVSNSLGGHHLRAWILWKIGKGLTWHLLNCCHNLFWSWCNVSISCVIICCWNPPSHYGFFAQLAVIWAGWWLGKNPSEKYELVNWDDEIPNIWENKKMATKPPTSKSYGNWPRGFLLRTSPSYDKHGLSPWAPSFITEKK